MEKLYGNKEEICDIFGVAKGTLSNDLTRMRRNPEFSKYILQPSHGRVNISIEGYEKFLKFRSEARKKYCNL
ncbi:DNA-binding protein [Lactococcus cremoris subsp. cremoris TIFN6]|uniref:DNA-binding protein n=1 Tax=Lactococcus cremoris subsp. cremoris TIFN6 TaxID=1234876 RepID=T0T8J5_LACLC|nr:DNA-binding protein [Lactococcus cremoris subsp. cremoris TIFN6]